MDKLSTAFEGQELFCKVLVNAIGRYLGTIAPVHVHQPHCPSILASVAVLVAHLPAVPRGPYLGTYLEVQYSNSRGLPYITRK